MQKHSLMLLAAATIGLAATQALAADLPRKAPPAYVPPAPPPITWTGCYIGANIGGIFSQGDATFAGVEVSGSNSGFAGGGQIGCDYQFAGGWVLGARNMFDGTSLHRDRTFFANGFSGTADFHINWFDTLTTRLGYTWAPGWLLYGQGGIAWVKSSTDITFAGFDFGDFGNRTRTGWTAGGGVEWMFTRGWSAFLEGNYMDFGSNDHTIFNPNCFNGVCDFNTHAKAATVLVGVNYRFGWLGKVKAPY